MPSKFIFSLISTLFLSIFSYGTTPSDSISIPICSDQELLEISKKVGFQLECDLSEYLPLYNEAIKWIGVRYRRSGMNSKGVDCSGLTSVIYRNVFNKKLLRRSVDMSRSIDQEIGKEELRPGDLVFFATRGRKNINHVGIFLGEKKFIHASITKGVIISDLDEDYYKRTWRKGGRFNLSLQQDIDIIQ